MASDNSNAALRWAPGGCTWCGSIDDVESYRDEPRCVTCRGHEDVIAAARRFIGTYGLRPLGGATTSDDEDELAHRVNARASRAALDATRLATRPTAARVRKADARPSAARPAKAVPKVDVAQLEERVTGLLTQMSAIDSEMSDIGEPSGLPARARLSDLERQRTTVLTTLAALEKARRSAR